jgi:hypothetical protein
MADDDCCICFLGYSESAPGVSLRCTHVFHEHCILKWAESKRPDKMHPTCPACRTDIMVVVKLPPSLDVLNLLEYTNFRKSYLQTLEDVKASDNLLYDSDTTDDMYWTGTHDYQRDRLHEDHGYA